MGKTLKTVAGAGAVLAAVAVGVHDLRVQPCARYVSRGPAAIAQWVNSDFAYNRLRGVASEQPLELFWVPDSGQVVLPPTRRTDFWTDVQGGYVALFPGRSLAMVALPWMWQRDTPAFFSEFARVNEARRVEELGQPIPEFLLFQEGGGVEGLRWQLVVSRATGLEVWGPLSGEGAIGPPMSSSLEPERVERWLSMASRAGLARRSVVHWQCDAIDGRVLSISYFDGKSLGRSHYVNSRDPFGPERELIEELDTFVRRSRMAS